MCCKKVFLNICSCETPIQISILSCRGCPIKTQTICSNHARVCFCTACNNISVIAKYNCQTICKKICLKNCFCQNVCVKFDFNKEQQFTLCDENYGLPVENAVLHFDEVD